MMLACRVPSWSAVVATDSLLSLLSTQPTPGSALLIQLLQRVEIVLTAHPTQVNRRTLQYKHSRIAALLAQNDRYTHPPHTVAMYCSQQQYDMPLCAAACLCNHSITQSGQILQKQATQRIMPAVKPKPLCGLLPRETHSQHIGTIGLC